MLIHGLDHVQIAAPPGCEASARWFFGDVLGMVEVEKPQSLRGRGGVWFAAGHQQLHVGVQEPFVPAGQAHPALRVAQDALDVVAARLQTAGVPVVWDVAQEDVRRFYAQDPWGNRIELLAARLAGPPRRLARRPGAPRPRPALPSAPLRPCSR